MWLQLMTKSPTHRIYPPEASISTMLLSYPRPHYSRYAPQKPNPIQVKFRFLLIYVTTHEWIGLRPESVVDDFFYNHCAVFCERRSTSPSLALMRKHTFNNRESHTFRISFASFKGISYMNNSDGSMLHES